MKKTKLLLTLILSAALTSSLFAKGDTYTYNFWDDIEKSPDAYRVSHVVYAADFNLDNTFNDVLLDIKSNIFAKRNSVITDDANIYLTFKKNKKSDNFFGKIVSSNRKIVYFCRLI